ncbi:unnamed protein product [Camellia sinensis]
MIHISKSKSKSSQRFRSVIQKVFVHVPSEIAAHDVQKLLFCCLILLLSSVLFLTVTARSPIFKHSIMTMKAAKGKGAPNFSRAAFATIAIGNGEMWDWHGEGYCLQKETNLDISPCLWDGVSQNEEDLSYMFDETTPVKACGDLAYHVADNVNMDKELQQCTEMSSQVKRRRMLQFDNEILGSPLCNEEISSVFLKSKEREDSLEEALSDMSHWVSGFEEETSATGHEGLDQSSEGWLADCFNNDEMHCSPDDLLF